MSQIINSSSYCYRVKGLFVPFQTPATIEKDIDDYINKIEKYTQRLDESFGQNDINTFIDTLEAIQAMLQAVYAKQCISYVNALINAAKNRGIEYCRRLLQQAVADLLLLSIEMQKAQIAGTAHAIKYKQIERNEEIARSLSAIIRLIGSHDYTKALSLSDDMQRQDDSFIKLSELIKTSHYDKAEKLADTMEKEHIGIIQQKGVDNSSKTVLAVDDRPEILSNVSAALRNHYRVLGAPGGRQAIEIMQHQKIDLFYLDIEMPEMDGFELARTIRDNPQYAKAPILFLTGNASRENIERGIGLGISDFIVKPSNHVNLLVKARMYMTDQK
ncbi:MAG: response regulator [Oscillospiraceae bacterium]|nr:response regulator [Oscillospiraceae bacterium]